MAKIPKMQRRHYEFVASVIRLSPFDDKTKLALAKEFAGRLSMTNGLFDSQRFIEASTRKEGT